MFVPLLDPRLRLVPLPGIRGSGARLGRAPPSEAVVPRALPFAGVPDVTCGLLMASRAALLSIMGYRRHVQTGVPMTHLSPKKYRFGSCWGNLSKFLGLTLLLRPSGIRFGQVRRATASAAASSIMAHEAARSARSSGSSRPSAVTGTVRPS